MAGVYVKRSLTSSTRALMGHTITVMAVIKRRKRRKRFFPLRERTVPSNRIYFTVEMFASLKEEKEKRTLTRTIFTRVACNFCRERSLNFWPTYSSTSFDEWKYNFVNKSEKSEETRHRKSIRVQNDRIWVMETRPKGFSDTTQPPVAIPLFPPPPRSETEIYFFRFTRIVTRCTFLFSL